MARPLRVEVAGGLYHVIVRGNERKSVFRDDADREWYLARLAWYRERFRFRLLAYCLMDNHVHLAVETGKAPLSRIMACLQSSYTQYFNRHYGRVGHLFQGRYKAFLVEKDRYALALLRYIHENPVKAGVAATAQAYRWSSDRDYRRGRGPEWLDVDRLLPMLGRTRPVALRNYRWLMREAEAESYEDVSSWGQAVKGDRAFADRALQAAGEPPVPPRLSVAAVAREAAALEGIKLAEMMGIGRGRRASRARLMTAWAGREFGAIPVARTAKYFLRDTSTLAKGLDRLKEAMQTDAGLRKRAERLRQALQAEA
jgi:REP element-mobilizing transposase RayT